VNDRDVASEKIGKLCEEEGGAQLRGQLLVEQDIEIVTLFGSSQNVGIDGHVAFAAACRHHHVHGCAQVFVVADAGIRERKAGNVGAEALPSFHLALVATLGDLQAPVDLGQGMDRVGREALAIHHRLRAGGGQFQPMRISTFSQRGDEADAGDDDVASAHEALPILCADFRLRRPWRRSARQSWRRDSS
jgi:hypothetical protein